MDSDAARLLIVDDDPEIRELIEAYLVQQGFEVSCAESGKQMFELLEQGEYDLIVLDLMLPGEHGLTLAGRVKREMNTPIIIVVSAVPMISFAGRIDWTPSGLVPATTSSRRPIRERWNWPG